MRIKSIFVLLSSLLLFQGCLFSSSKPSTTPSISLPSGYKNIYQGGLFKIIGTFPTPLDLSDISWRTGVATIDHHSYVYKSGQIAIDTAFFLWKVLPKGKIDTIKPKDTTQKATYDTTYIDSIGVIGGPYESKLLDIQMANFLPQIDTVIVGGFVQNISTQMIVLPAHRGGPLTFTLHIQDLFNRNYAGIFSFDSSANISVLSQSDSTWVFQWNTPNTLMEDTIILHCSDTRGLGKLDIKVHRFTYNESGSLWIGAGNQITKMDENGRLIYRSDTTFGFVSDIAVHPTENMVWVSDQFKQNIVRYDWDGNLILSDSGFTQPNALGINVVTDLLLVADKDKSTDGELKSFNISVPNQIPLVATVDNNHLGPLGSLSINQYDATITWYTIPQENRIMKSRNGIKDTLVLRNPADSSIITLNRPTYIAYDAKSSRVWISDSTSLVLADTSGFVKARVYGFEFINGAVAENGSACIIDSRLNQLYLFNSNISGLNLDLSSGTAVNGFAKPLSVDMSYSDGSCWVADRDAGTIVHVNSSGGIMQKVSGFTLPTVVRVHKGVE